MKLIKDNGQPRYGRFTQAPSAFNIQDYANPFLKTGLRQKLRYKKFSFVAIQHQHFSIGMAIADLSWIGHGFYYCHDQQSQQTDEHHALKLAPFALQVQEASTQNQFNFFKSKSIEIFSKHRKNARQILIRQQDQILCQAEIDCRHREPLYLCSPTGVRGWTYTHKSMALAVQGYVQFQGEKIDFDTRTLASLDDSCGYLRPETEWFWLSCQTWLNGQTLAINLASGVNESVGNENCLWLNGQLLALEDVIFERIASDTWHIYALNQQIDLTVHTTWRRYENIHAGFVASEFSQWVAKLSGVIVQGETKIQLNAVTALLEEHYAKW